MNTLYFKPERNDEIQDWLEGNEILMHFYGMSNFWSKEIHYPIMTSSIFTGPNSIKDCIGINIITYEE